MTPMRIMLAVYIAQAALGIAAGFAYAMWLMYPA